METLENFLNFPVDMTDDIHKYLDKVLQSSEFENSARYQKLLEYLVHASLAGNVPKEITIAMEVFGLEMKDDNLGESNIRVYIHTLRKKLDSYYLNEGKTDRVHFVIPKGRYKVEFVKQKPPGNRFSRNLYIFLTSIIALLILFDIFFRLVNPISSSSLQKNTYSKWIWKDFMSRDVPLTVVVGDYYLLKDVTFSDRVRFLRDVRINSEEDYDRFLKDYPQYEDTYDRTRHTFMGKYSAICMNELGRIMYGAGKEFEVILSSEFQWQTLKSNNLIYIGTFKSMGILDQLLKESNFTFNLYPSDFLFHELDTDSLYHYYPFDSDLNDPRETDYCVVTKLPGSDQNDVLMFISIRDIGLIGTMDYFTNPESLASFGEMLNNGKDDTEYFEACFRIQGLHRNSMTIDLLHVNRLTPVSIFNKNPDDQE